MSALLAGAGDRIDELKQLTRELNLHVPPSSFASKVSQVPYEQALAPMLAADTGPLHLYVGVPLCEEHCRFCMYFYGLADASGADAEECVASMETFLAALAGSVERPVAGMYVGGGTPTVLSAEQIRRLLAAVNGAFEFEPNSQQTFEMSPRSFSPEKARAIAESGVHRVSFGLQSFDPEPVRRAGRGYVGPEAVGELIRSCLAVGIDEINADLMVGLDGESDDSLSRSVEQLLDLGCPTISIYRYRQARKVELDDAGGLDAYVATCAGRVERAVEIARSRGREVSGRIDGEHIRLVAPGEPRWEERNLYETRYRPRLRNSLVGVGSGARSFLRDEAMVHCAHRAADGFGLLGRPVEVEECDEEARASAALVNALFREFEVDLDELARQESVDPMTHFGSQLDHLVSVGVLIQDGQRLVVAPPHRGEWAYWDKLLYPPAWLQRRRRSWRLRVR
ncbi:MAG: radical SAM protein [Candidatus Microthrix sp.]|nr:radical SAM protein [Candidatus Microthrix sp.]